MLAKPVPLKNTTPYPGWSLVESLDFPMGDICKDVACC